MVESVANQGAKWLRVLGLVSFTCIPICGIIRNEERIEKEEEPDCFDCFGRSSGKPLATHTFSLPAQVKKKIDYLGQIQRALLKVGGSKPHRVLGNEWVSVDLASPSGFSKLKKMGRRKVVE